MWRLGTVSGRGKGRSRQRFLTRDPHLSERRERESNSLEDGRVDPADRLEGEDHPLTTPSGTNRATIFVSPAPSATRTTSSTFLYAPGASSTIPAREAARREIPRLSSALTTSVRTYLRLSA